MPKNDWIEPLAYGVGGAVTNFIVNHILEKQFPALSVTKQKLISGGSVSGASAATAYALDKNQGYYFAMGALGYTATSLTYQIFNQSKIRGASSIAMEKGAVVDDILIVDGVEEPIATKGLFKLVDWKEEPAFDLESTGKFNRRNTPIKRVVLHHGGYDPYNLANIFKGGREASTHFGIGYDKNGDVIVAQYMDPKHQAWHAGHFNKGSIGIDFAFVPTVENRDRYGWPVVDVPSNRFKSIPQVLEVPDEILDATVQFLKELHRVLGLEMRVNRDIEALASSYEDLENSELGDATVIGHHNVSNNRFDVFYVWDRLLERTDPQSNV